MAISTYVRITNSIKLLTSSRYLGVKYSKFTNTLNNWGDALNVYLIPRLSGREIIHCREYYSGLTPTLCGIGSILDKNSVRNLYVWGSGLKSPKSPIPVLPKKVFAVRGLLTQQRLKVLGVDCPDVFGDPAIILPRFYKPKSVVKKFKLGVIPHYVDKASERIRNLALDPEVSIIDIESGIEEFIEKISACEVIASSSLHGIIAADSYQIPRVWIKLSDKVAGGDFKFQDYFSTTDVKNNLAFIPDQTHMSLEYVRRAVQPQRLADIDRLIQSFPF